MTERESVSLRCPPPPPPELVGFPVARLPDIAFRVTRAGRRPWWFSNSMEGRFDLPAPLGACYVAAEAVNAVVEVIGADVIGGLVSTRFIGDRRIWEVPAARPTSLADSTSNGARRFGVTNEIGTVVPYSCPQQWARSLHASGFDGVQYHLRHVPSAGTGCAVFDDASSAPAAAVRLGPGGFERTDWDVGAEHEISDGIVLEMAKEFGIHVAPPPRLSELSEVDLPQP